MEARVMKLEVIADLTGKRLDRVETKLDALAVGFAKLEERVAHLPTKGFTVTALLTILTLLTTITLFQGKIQGFLGLVPR